MEQVIGFVVYAFALVLMGAAVWMVLQLMNRKTAVGLAEYIGIIYRGGSFDGVYDADSQYCFVFDVDNGGRFTLLEDSIVSSLVELTDDDGQAVFYSLTGETEGEYVVARPFIPQPEMGWVSHQITILDDLQESATVVTISGDGVTYWHDLGGGKRVEA